MVGFSSKLLIMDQKPGYINVQDNDFHWYYIPKDLEADFEKDLEEADKDYHVSFIEKYSGYMTGGGPVK